MASSRAAYQKAWAQRNAEHLKQYHAELYAQRKEARRYVDEVVVAELVAGRFGGKATKTERKVAVAACLMRGFSNVETARRIGVSVKTIERHRRAARDEVGNR